MTLSITNIDRLNFVKHTCSLSFLFHFIFFLLILFFSLLDVKSQFISNGRKLTDMQRCKTANETPNYF